MEAYCLKCDEVVLCESLPDAEQIEVYVSGLDRQRTIQYQLPEIVKEAFKTSLASWIAWADAARGRRRLCLACGSPVLPLVRSSGSVSQECDEPNRRYEHPGCLGVLAVWHGISRHSIEEPDIPRVIRYSPTGIRLDQIPVPWEVAVEPATRDPLDVDVHLLDAGGFRKVTWRIGREISQEAFEQAYNSEAKCLYALVLLEHGEERISLTTQEQWLQVKAVYDRTAPDDLIY